MTRPGLRPLRWQWDGTDCRVHDGYTDGKYWKGFPHVRVTPEVYAGIMAELDGEDCAGLDSLTVDEDGLIDLQGYCAVEVTDDEVTP